MDIFNNQPLMALLTTVAIVAFADFVLAVLAAVARKQFQIAFLADWVESHLAARVVPIAVVAVLGAQNPALFGIAAAAAATYVAETVASIKNTLIPPPAQITSGTTPPTA